MNDQAFGSLSRTERDVKEIKALLRNLQEILNRMSENLDRAEARRIANEVIEESRKHKP